MKKLFLLLLVTMVATSAYTQQPPDTEIYLFDLSVKKGKISISKPVNISAHKGYDNQPFFHPQKPIVYYTSAAENGNTDLVGYNYKDKQTTAITRTPEKEYSPTVTLDGQFLSCIIQRENGAQDLGKYPMDGSEPFIIIDNLKVGYHVWADNSHLGLYVLGNEGSPNTLHYLLLPIKKDTILAQNIGRSLHRIPGESAISFIQLTTEKEGTINRFDTQSRRIDPLGPTVPGSQDLCWTPDGRILMSDGTKLFFSQPGSATGWKEVTVVGESSMLMKVTRLAVSADGKKLAVVVTE